MYQQIFEHTEQSVGLSSSNHVCAREEFPARFGQHLKGMPEGSWEGHQNQNRVSSEYDGAILVHDDSSQQNCPSQMQRGQLVLV